MPSTSANTINRIRLSNSDFRSGDYDFDSRFDDFLLQIRWELDCNSDSYIANELTMWYDSLYRESKTIDTYDPRTPEEESEVTLVDLPSQEVIDLVLEFFTGIPIGDARDILTELTRTLNRGNNRR